MIKLLRISFLLFPVLLLGFFVNLSAKKPLPYVSTASADVVFTGEGEGAGGAAEGCGGAEGSSEGCSA